MLHRTLANLMTFGAGTVILMAGLPGVAPAQAAFSHPIEWIEVSAVDSNATGMRLRLIAPDSAVQQVRADQMERHGDTLIVSLPASLALRDGFVDLTLRVFESASDVRVTFPTAERDHRTTVEAAQLTIRRESGRVAVYSASGTMRTRTESLQP